MKFFKTRKYNKLTIKLARKEAELASHFKLQGRYECGHPLDMHDLAGEIAEIKQKIEILKAAT